ncbi:hypothetical protein B296_00005986 [Ensete ventricosum]|uniref:F-box domain-containing protein n=1 Tax=Ensete ventricosum TaxID=4639 RepID=A0A427ACV2_ENSVE|nr:hypothetical protein B296_00005986 [Ensete ventricosum]
MEEQRKRTAVSSFIPGRSRRRRWSPPSPLPAPPTAAASFADLPFDVLARLAAPFDVPTLWAASTVCQSWREALRPLREAMVLLRLGKGYKRGRGPGIGRPNPHRALEYFLKGVDRGSAPAMVDAGLMYWEMGKKEEAEALYRRAAELGYPVGQCNLGVCYLEADQPKSEEAVKWFYRAAESGYASAQYNLALCLHKGRGVKNDVANAKKKPSPPFHLERRKEGDGRAGEDVTGRLRPQLELIPREALCNDPTVTRSGGDPALGELISRSPIVSPSTAMRKKTQMMTRAGRGSSSLTLARIPSFVVDRRLPNHSGHDPSAPYRVPPDGALLRVPPCPTPFLVMPSSSNERRSLVFLAIVLFILSTTQFEHGLELYSSGAMTEALVYLELATRAGVAEAAGIRNRLVQSLCQASRDHAMLRVERWQPL